MQGGAARVLVEGAGPHDNSTITLAVPDSRGAAATSVIQLPAVALKSLRIAPLAGTGSYGIDSLVLLNGTRRYAWDDSGACRQRYWNQGRARTEPCGPGSPGLAVAADGSVLISSIPDAGTRYGIGTRLAAGLCVALGVLVCAAWLLAPSNGGAVVVSARLIWLAVAALYAYQLSLILRYAVDVPCYEEWDYFQASGLPSGLTLEWLFSFRNGHRIVPTHLMAWLNLKLFGLDFALQKLLNHVFFGGLLVAIVAFKRRITGAGGAFPLFPAFLIFLVSSIASENHLWSYQSQIHLVLLFSLLALLASYQDDMTLGTELIFSGLCVLSMFTMSAGIGLSLVFVSGKIIYAVAGIVHGRMPRRRTSGLLVMDGTIIGVALVLWFRGFSGGEAPISASSLFGTAFWDFFLNVVGLGFGARVEDPLPGAVWLAAALLPVLLLVARRETRWRSSTWLVMTLTIGILAVLAMIALGRTANPALCVGPKTSRYAEFGFLLIPAMSLAWWLAVKSRIRRVTVLSLVWGGLFIGYRGDWSPVAYQAIWRDDVLTLECVEPVLSGDRCEAYEPAEELERAMQVHARFTRQFAPDPRRGP